MVQWRARRGVFFTRVGLHSELPSVFEVGALSFKPSVST